MHSTSSITDSTVSLESVLCTDELNRRPSRPPDYEAESRALNALAQALTDSPGTILQAMAEVILETVRADSAGLSLLTKDDGGKRFYWPAIAGVWKPHIGGGTPRDFGPCGDVLDRNCTLLFTHPERRYPYLVPVSPPIVECLLVPFHVERKAVGTVWVIAHDEGRHFDAEDQRLLTSLGRFASAAYKLWSAQKTGAQQLSAARQLQQISTQLIQEGDIEALYQRILDAAVAIMGSDFASMQLVDESEDALRMLAWRGFDPAFGKTFELNRPDTKTSCSAARRLGHRVVVPDVETCDFIVGTTALGDHRKLGIRAVQSTPLFSRDKRMLGMISTHWRAPHEPAQSELGFLDVLARQAADLIERKQAEEGLARLRDELAVELHTMARLQEISTRLVRPGDLHTLLGEILDAAIELTRADLGNIQLRHPACGEVKIIAQRGFPREFLEFFDSVHDGMAACGTAMRTGARVIVEDVANDAIFKGTRAGEVMLAAGARAVQSTPLLDRYGQLIGMLSTHYRFPHRPAQRDLQRLDLLARQAADLIERQSVEDALRKSEANLRFAHQAAHAGAWTWDGASGLVTWSKECYDLFGIDPDAPLLYESWRSMLHSDDRERADFAARHALERGQDLNVEYRINHPQRGLRWLTSIGRMIDPVGRPGYMTGISLDITERKRAGEARAMLAAIVASSDDAIVSKNLDGIVTSWNAGAERLFGFSADEAIGQSITFIIPADRREEERDILGRLRRGELIEHFETVRMAKDGRPIDVSLTVSPIRGDANRIIGASKVARDITRQKSIQRERDVLLESERAARYEAEQASWLKDEFLSTLSHELRTPISAISGWSHLIQRNLADSKTVEEGMQVISRNAKVQVDLISDLLDMSSIISGKVRLNVDRLDLPAVVQAAIDSVRHAAEAKEIRIEAALSSLAAVVRGDPSRLQQVFWNLLSNAVKFTPRGGRVQVVLATNGSHAEIEISDTGKGIAADFLPFVFDRFRQADASITRRHGGLGLGLAIVKQLVELHGGWVRAASAGEAAGSTFTVGLPFALAKPKDDSSPAAQAASSPGPCDIDLRGVRVLAVDDQPDARDFVKRILEECQAEVLVAASADEALHLLNTHSPHVLVSDVGMPGTDGYEFIRLVRESGDQRPAIAVTALARSEDRTRALRAGYHGHIAKPMDPAELIAAVAAFAKPHNLMRSVERGTRNGE